MRAVPLIALMLLPATPTMAATLLVTKSFTGTAFVHTPADDYPNAGYSPPGSLGGYKGLLTFDGFDTTLGTLNAVSLHANLASTAEFKDAFAYGSSITLNYNLEGFGQGPFGSMPVTNAYTFFVGGTTFGHTYDTGAQSESVASGTSVYNLPPFTPFLSTLYVPVDASFVNQGGNGSYLTNVTSTFTYALTIGYDYTPAAAVPEPAAWAMMLVGFGVIGFGARRRQNLGVTYA